MVRVDPREMARRRRAFDRDEIQKRWPDEQREKMSVLESLLEGIESDTTEEAQWLVTSPSSTADEWPRPLCCGFELLLGMGVCPPTRARLSPVDRLQSQKLPPNLHGRRLHPS